MTEKTSKILLVDDDPDLLRLLSIRLKAEGYDVKAVESGAAALATAGTFHPDLVITDLRMDQMDGIGLLNELQRRYPGLRVDPDPIYVKDGPVYTSAGVTAGMDLALALVEEDWGREVALGVARWLVLFLKRPGGQSSSAPSSPPSSPIGRRCASSRAGSLSTRTPISPWRAWLSAPA